MRVWRNSSSCTAYRGCELTHPLQLIVCSFLQNVKAELTFGLIILPQVQPHIIERRILKRYWYIQVHSRFPVTSNRENDSNVCGWINVYTKCESWLALRMQIYNGILLYLKEEDNYNRCTTSMNLEDVMTNEIWQLQKDLGSHLYEMPRVIKFIGQRLQWWQRIIVYQVQF